MNFKNGIETVFIKSIKQAYIKQQEGSKKAFISENVGWRYTHPITKHFENNYKLFYKNFY